MSQPHLSSRRIILAVPVGAGLGILLANIITNAVIALAVGCFLALAVADLRRPKQCALLAATVATLIGLYLAIRPHSASTGWPPLLDYSRLAVYILSSVAIAGSMGALLGFITATLRSAYDKGQGPLF